MKKIFAFLAVSVVLSSASFAQTGKMSSDTTHKSMHKTMHKKVATHKTKKDSTKM